ncbi:hypothetical protein J2X36_005388 [Methylobacterium sp. BE186]|nr:hypothetical protein [Methylobacterium sp. BE186]
MHEQRCDLIEIDAVVRMVILESMDRGSVGPVFRSVTEDRFFHFATVFGLTP